MTTAFRTVKKGEQPKLDAVTVALERHDGTIHSITLTDASGRSIKVTSAYGMSVLVPAEPEKERKSVVKGDILGVPVRETFESEFEAKERQREIERIGGAVEVATEEVEIPF